MRKGLIAEKRVDINGKTTTRWVKAGADNKPAPRGIPAPKSKNGQEIATSIRMTLFPETQVFDDHPGEEYAVTINGTSTFYSPQFAQQTLERVPAHTKKLLEETLNGLENDKTKRWVAQTVYDMMREMYDMGGTAAAPQVLKEQSRIVANTCTFSGAMQALNSVEGTSVNAVNDIMFMLDTSLAALENDGYYRGNPGASQIDYSKEPRHTREHAQNYVMADQLHRQFGSFTERLSDAHVALAASYRGDWERLIKVVQDRGFDDTDLIRSIMDSETPAISEGML